MNETTAPSAQMRAIGLLEQATRDLQRGDRVDALDSMRQAERLIRSSSAHLQPPPITEEETAQILATSMSGLADEPIGKYVRGDTAATGWPKREVLRRILEEFARLRGQGATR
jgi:hypothetical protein